MGAPYPKVIPPKSMLFELNVLKVLFKLQNLFFTNFYILLSLYRRYPLISF